MSVLTSDDDFKTPTVAGSGKFTKFDASGDESSISSLLDPQMLQDEREKVKIGCFYMKKKVRDELVVAGLMLAVILFGAGNSVSSRIKGQAMGHFNFFASLGNAVIYVVLYFSILLFRRVLRFTPPQDIIYPWTLDNSQTGEEITKANQEVLDHPFSHSQTHSCRLLSIISSIWSKIPPFKFFLLMGLMDGLGNILGLIAQPYISGQLASVMTQAIVAYSMLCAMIMLGTRYTYWQVWGMVVILGGTMICLFANGLNMSSSSSKGGSQMGYALIMLVSTLPNALSFTLKELVFSRRPKLDIFVVNSNSSLFQLLLWPIFLPLTMLFDQTGGLPFGQYLKDGFACFVGKYQFPPGSPYDCSSMPYPFLVYIAFNLAYNIALLLLLKQASALQAFMANKAVLPVSFLLFYFKWPLISPSPINAFILIGLAVILLGLVFYRLASISKSLRPSDPLFSSCLSPHFSLSSPSTSFHSSIN